MPIIGSILKKGIKLRETLEQDYTSPYDLQKKELSKLLISARNTMFGREYDFMSILENKVQELTRKHEELPKDIRWHMIGHLQRNKVKYIAPFVHLIHAVDSLRLLVEINKQAEKNERVINCLLQVYIAKEESKFGLDEKELEELLNSDQFAELNNIKVVGLMGMATNTDNEEVVRKEFKSLKALFEELKNKYNSDKNELKELSMGMTGDYKIALEEGSTMIRVGSAIFGSRNYQ